MLPIWHGGDYDGWMDFKKLNGWSLGECDDAKKTHSLLKHYSALADKKKTKTRLPHARHYLEIVAMAGYKICGMK